MSGQACEMDEESAFLGDEEALTDFAECRVCRDTGKGIPSQLLIFYFFLFLGSNLIHPCDCTGSISGVHPHCLQTVFSFVS
jgi:E3 ubiquitin-protein ligase DOA10